MKKGEILWHESYKQLDNGRSRRNRLPWGRGPNPEVVYIQE
ncbi:mCG147293 [Mus musculus]|nr:mCG147293 [Mus musculus]